MRGYNRLLVYFRQFAFVINCTIRVRYDDKLEYSKINFNLRYVRFLPRGKKHEKYLTTFFEYYEEADRRAFAGAKR